jgi:hypothetical protein
MFSLKFSGPISKMFTFIPSHILPPFTWVIYIIYYLFPSKKYFNGQTRYFLKLLIIDMFKSPFTNFTFIIPWATDQFLSFAVSLRDFFYTSCYTIFLIKDGNIDNMTCHSSTNIIVRVLEAIMIYLPLYLRMGQCLNRMHFAKNRYGKLKNYTNFFKYFLSTITVIFSMLIPVHSSFFWIWIASVIIATIVSYFWDIKYDFGFLEFYKVNGKLSFRKYFSV